MNMLGRFQRSWHLFQASLAVLRQQPKLLAFPVVIAGCTAGMLLFFLAPLNGSVYQSILATAPEF